MSPTPLPGGVSLLVSDTKKSNAAETNHLGLWTGIREFYDKLGQKLIRYWVVGGLLLFSASLAREGPGAVELIDE